METLNQGGLFRLYMEVIPVVNLGPDDREAEFIVILGFEAESIDDGLLEAAIRQLFPKYEIVKRDSRFIIQMVSTVIHEEKEYLEKLGQSFLEYFKNKVPNWGADVRGDLQFADDYRDLH